MKKKALTSIKDIARAARVSHSTVSRALRQSPLVNPKTAERICRIARETGFRTNAVARSLVTGETRTLGVAVTTIADPFISEVVAGVEDVANEHGYSVVLANSHADPERELRVVHSFAERRVDGVLVLASRVGALYLPVLAKMKIPIVLVNNQQEGEFVHSVGIDNVAASCEITRHLIALGHQRIGYVGDRLGMQSDAERFAGYRQALQEAKLTFAKEWVTYGNGRAEGGQEAMRQLLSLRRRPTAVFCYNDLTAIGALAAAREAGLSVPADISVAGFDDLEMASFTYPPLTTVRQPKQQMGRMAAEILLRLLAGTECESNCRVSGELVVRGSTGPPGRKS